MFSFVSVACPDAPEAGRSAANITLTVRPLPATPDSAETDAASAAESDNSRAPINELFHGNGSISLATCQERTHPLKNNLIAASNGTWRSKSKHHHDADDDDDQPLKPSNSVPDEPPTGPLFSDQEQVTTVSLVFFHLAGATLRYRRIDTRAAIGCSLQSTRRRAVSGCAMTRVSVGCMPQRGKMANARCRRRYGALVN